MSKHLITQKSIFGDLDIIRKAPTSSEVKKSDLKHIRRFLFDYHSGCQVLQKNGIPFEDTAVDHDHKSGYIRGVLQKQVNSFEGKALTDYKRLGLANLIEFPDLLINLGQYLKFGNISHLGLTHPSEIKHPKLKKASYNKLKKVCKVKMPAYNTRLTKTLMKLFNRYHIRPEFYKR